MEIMPSIDLMCGQVVRLTKGDPKTSKTYFTDYGPLGVAQRWKKEGADSLHIVDLDATLGTGENRSIISEINRLVEITIQVAGGIRNYEEAERLLNNGVDRIVVATLALKEPFILVKLLKKFGNRRIVVALDHLGPRVMMRGWKAKSDLNLFDALDHFMNLGTKIFLVTDIERDGTLQGPNIEILSKACKVPGIEVIASGGVSELNDITKLKSIGASAAILGKALYEGKIDLKEALRTARGE